MLVALPLVDLDIRAGCGTLCPPSLPLTSRHFFIAVASDGDARGWIHAT